MEIFDWQIGYIRSICQSNFSIKLVYAGDSKNLASRLVNSDVSTVNKNPFGKTAVTSHILLSSLIRRSSLDVVFVNSVTPTPTLHVFFPGINI